MQYNQRKKAIILLEDGTIFHGKSIGKEGSAFGEVCFKLNRDIVTKYAP